MAQREAVRSIRSSRIPPHNLDAEQSVLGAMLESKDAVTGVFEILEGEDFYKPAHTEIFEAIISLFNRGEAPDAITVADELTRRGTLDSIGGKPYILGLIDAYPTASAATRYARIVEEHARLRRLVGAGNEIQEIGFSIPEDVDAAVNEAEEIVYKIADRRMTDDVQPIRKLLTESMDEIERTYERGESITGLASGFHDLDDMTSGFQNSNLIIVAARPAMGKSSLMADFVLNAALRQQQPVVFFNLEMSRHEITKRFLASEGKVDSQRISKGTLQEQDWARLSGALGRLAEAPIFIDDSPNITLMEIRAKCRRIKAKFGLGLVVIDYLQLMTSPRKSENRQQEVSEISRNLKILARELHVPVVCASQLNRGVEFRSDKRPLLGDLRESGCLTGETRVALASGAVVPIADLVGAAPAVVALDGWTFSPATAVKVWKTGVKPVYKLKTATGREIRATENHPFLQLSGWKPLGDLRVGDRVGVARSLPDVYGPPTDTRYGGSSHFSFSPREVLTSNVAVLDDLKVKDIAGSDIFWDEVVSIEADGVEAVYDMTVPGPHNFVANGIVVHNSIEQDSDVVMFIYRDEVYNQDSEARGEAELIIAKHRNGPVGTVRLAFMNQYTKFASIAKVPGH